MQVTETTADGLKREFTVVVPAGDVEDKLVSRLAEIGQTVTVPGFRPGKVPVSLLRKRYGEAVRGEVLERTIQDSWQKALVDNGLRPASEPKIEIVTFEEGADLEYKLNVELMPEIEPIDFSSLELERRVARVEEKEVDAAIQRLAEGRRSFASVSDDRACQQGDQVVVDFRGTIDGEAFAGGEVDDFELELGAGGFLPGFEEQITGMKAGETREIRIQVADDHPNDQLRGKEVTFDVTVKEVREARPVAVDDEFAKSAGAESLEALKAMVRSQMENEYSQMSRAHLKRALLDKLEASHAFELPEGILEAEFEGIWKQVLDAKERGTLDDDDKELGEDELRARYRKIAERRVKLGLLISEIGRANNITVTQDDLNRAMHREASRLPGQEAQVLQYFQQNPEAMQELQAPIFEDKVIDFIIEMATVTDKKVPLEALMSDPEEEAAGEATEDEKGSKRKAKGRARSRAKAADEK